MMTPDPGIEPELLFPVPRRVVSTAPTVRLRIWCANLLAFVLLGAYFLGKNYPDILPALTVVLILAGCGIAALWLDRERNFGRSRYFLSQGHAVRATVTRSTALDGYDEYTEITYRYPLSSGAMAQESVIIGSSKREELGGISEGSTFTVLRHPGAGLSTMPYFLIEGVRLPGAAPAKIYTASTVSCE